MLAGVEEEGMSYLLFLCPSPQLLRVGSAAVDTRCIAFSGCSNVTVSLRIGLAFGRRTLAWGEKKKSG